MTTTQARPLVERPLQMDLLKEHWKERLHDPGQAAWEGNEWLNATGAVDMWTSQQTCWPTCPCRHDDCRRVRQGVAHPPTCAGLLLSLAYATNADGRSLRAPKSGLRVGARPEQVIHRSPSLPP